MIFEEFFKRKKISLQLLQEAEPALFSEFKLHYEQMGEKSFDHTKKYWFNQLRRKFPAPPEVKAEKVVIENQLAEQTIADTLTGTATSAPNVGFKPRFKAAMASKPATDEQPKAPEAPAAEEKPAEDAAPLAALGFKPKFRAANPPKPVVENQSAEENTESKAEAPAQETKPAPALGFKPKFKSAAKPTTTAEEKLEASPEDSSETPVQEAPNSDEPKSLGFKPRFSAKNIKPKE